MSSILRRKDLDRTMNWLCQVLGIGPGLGDVFFVASSGSAYESWLKKIGAYSDHLFTTVPAAYAATTDLRNDVVCLSPELHTITSEIAWAKSHTHLVGLGGPNTLGRFARPNCMIYSNTGAMGYNIHLTGANCQFHNLGLQTGTTGVSGADGTTYGPMLIAGYGNYFKRVAFRGINNTAQIAAAACSSLEISNGAGELMFEECQIGQNGWGGIRTSTTQGHLLFTADATVPSPQNGVFMRCRFLDRTNIAGVTTVYQSSLYGTDRLWLFEDCFFDNWNDTWGTANNLPTAVFKNFLNAQGASFRLRGCSMSGYTYWTEDTYGNAAIGVYKYMSDGPLTGTGGGLMHHCNGVAGA